MSVYHTSGIADREAKLLESKALLIRQLEACVEVLSSDASVTEKPEAVAKLHQAIVAHANFLESAVAQENLSGASDNEHWRVYRADTALSFLNECPRIFKMLTEWSETLELSPHHFRPGQTTFAELQRLVAEVYPSHADALRRQFEGEGLPIHGFQTPLARTRLSASLVTAPHNYSSNGLGKLVMSDAKANLEELRTRATIGIIAALPKEFAALRLVFGDGHGELRVAGRGAGRRFRLVRLHSQHGGVHVIAMALLPDIGNNAAVAAASILLELMPNIQHVIMCGIAGGIPNPTEPEHDVRLGDVVVSNRNGVVQYDLVKEHPDGTTENRAPPRPPAPALLEAVQYLEVEEELGKSFWPDDPSQLSDARWQRPPDNVDAKGNIIALSPDPMRRAGIPRVFRAPIASANRLLKNESHRDYLGRRFGVKAVEMEGSGIADAAWFRDGAGYLVVRGIVDYCDEQKGDRWHHAAALAAASYTRALLASMPAKEETSTAPPVSGMFDAEKNLILVRTSDDAPVKENPVQRRYNIVNSGSYSCTPDLLLSLHNPNSVTVRDISVDIEFPEPLRSAVRVKYRDAPRHLSKIPDAAFDASRPVYISEPLIVEGRTIIRHRIKEISPGGTEALIGMALESRTNQPLTQRSHIQTHIIKYKIQTSSSSGPQEPAEFMFVVIFERGQFGTK